MRNLYNLMTIVALFGFAYPTMAQTQTSSKSLSTSIGVVAFPAKGQTTQQQSKDEGECYNWSRMQTGFDPMNPSTSLSSVQSSQAAIPPPQQGHRVKGALRGAAAGAVIGEVADDDASKGAEIGAVVGVLKGGAERRRQHAETQQHVAQQQQQLNQEQKLALQQQVSLFTKGFSACLESKGYTVK